MFLPPCLIQWYRSGVMAGLNQILHFLAFISSIAPTVLESPPLAAIEFVDEVGMTEAHLGIPLILSRNQDVTKALTISKQLLRSSIINYKALLNITSVKEDNTFSAIWTRGNALYDTINVINDTYFNNVFLYRNKRAFIDLGGDLLSSVFGVATEKQLELVKTHFDNRLLPMELSIKSISLETKLLQTSLMELTKSIQHQIKIVENNLKISMVLWQIEHALSSASDIIAYSSEIVARERSILSSLNNNLLPNIFDDYSLNITISEGLAKFPNCKFPLAPSNYSLLKNIVQIERSISPREFLLLIPFVSKETFSRYELIPLPLLVKTTPVVVQNVFRFVGISRLMYFESKEVFSCNKIGNFCEGNPRLVPLEVNSCSLQLVQKNSPNDCIMDNLNFQQKPFIQTSLKNSYIFFETVTPIEVDCGLKSKEIFTKGNYKLSKACSLKSKFFTIPAFKEAVFSQPIFFNNDYNNSFLNNVSLQFVPKFLNEHVFDDLAVNLSKLYNSQKTNFSILDVKSSKIHFQTKILISANSIIFVIIIVVLFSLIILWKKLYYNNRFRNSSIHFSPLNYRDQRVPAKVLSKSTISV